MNSRDQLTLYLRQLEKRLRLGAFLRGAAAIVSVALTTTVLLVLITNAFAFSDISMIFARVALVLTLAAAISWGLAVPWRALNRRRAASKAEAVFPQFGQRLVTFAERDKSDRDPFLELLASDTLEVARQAAPAALVSNRNLAAWLACGAASLVVLVWIVAAGPGFVGYGAARLWAGSLRTPQPFYEIRVTPGDTAVRRNGNQLVTAQVVGRLVENAHLYARYGGASKWDQVAMQRQPAAATFQFLFAGLPESVEYYVEAGPLRSRNFKLRVIDLPQVKQIRVTYHFPAWTGLKDKVEEHGGDLRAVQGTKAELNVLFSQPVSGAFLALNDGSQIHLSTGNRNSRNGSLGIEKDGQYHIATTEQGQPVRLSDDFFIEARKVNPPEVRITRPTGEYHASPIEEVTVSVHGDDDYGLNEMALHYSVNGGPEKIVPLLKQKGSKSADGSTTIALEDFKLSPGDLVTFYGTGKDARAESHTDMAFIQAEPFEREYSQSQVMGGGGGGGMGDGQNQISQREKEIIAETWKHQLTKNTPAQELAEAAKFLSGVQSKLQEQSVSLAGRLERRELTEQNHEFSEFQKDMNTAAQAMAPAARALGQEKWKEALPNEQKALQYLLRAEATFREIQLAFGNAGGGAGSGRDLQSLFDLELDTEKNQYETEQTANSANQRATEIDKALEKLDELARRQQELAQQHSNPQDFQSRWEQEMLRREAEKLQQQMAQMARNSSQQNAQGSSGQSSSGAAQTGANSSVQQALERLRQAEDDMRRATSAGQNGADARRAAERLREAASLLNNLQNHDVSQRLGSMTRESQRLSSEQRSQSERMQRSFDPAEVAKRNREGSQMESDQDLEKLADDRQHLADDLAKLEKQMQDATRDLGGQQGAAASKLRDALNQMQQSGLESRLERGSDLLRRGMNPNNSPGEAAVGSGLERLSQQLRDAQKALGSGQQGSEEALNRLESLRSQLDALSRGLGAQSGQSGQPGQPNQQAGQSGQRGPANQQSGQWGPAGGPGAAIQTGQAGMNRSGDIVRNGQATPYNGGRWDGDRFYGGYDPGSYSRPQGNERQPVPLTQADIERAYQEALADLNALRQSVRGQPEPLGNIQELLREIGRLDPRRFPGNPAMLDELHNQVLSTVDKLELQIRRSMDSKQSGQVRTADGMRVPDGYQDSVADYFRRLSKLDGASQH